MGIIHPLGERIDPPKPFSFRLFRVFGGRNCCFGLSTCCEFLVLVRFHISAYLAFTS